MQRDMTAYKCDNCGRVHYEKSSQTVPIGWRNLKFWDEGAGDEPDRQDLCDSCSAAILSTLGNRKRIEKGRHVEVEAQEHLPGRFQADAIANTRMRKAEEASTSSSS